MSSKLKQVSKNDFNQFNIKTIPFVTTSSTTPSHNLGLNIQQVLNIMKTQHPVSGISPTLAHNMGLVTQSMGSYVQHGTKQTVTNILSRIGSRPNCTSPIRKPTCALLRHATAVAESELADVPEHPNEDNMSVMSSSLNVIDISKCGTEFDLKTRAMTEWDQPSPRACTQPKCTCLPRKQTMNSNKIFNQFLDPNCTESLNQQIRPKCNKNGLNQQSTVNTVPNKFHLPPNEYQKQMNPTKINNSNPHTELAGKVRGLRDVLTKLHNDFQHLNDQYDQLNEHIQNNQMDVDSVTIYKLRAMEKELNAKEVEISVVMSLYEEVLNLKEQVRNLKERTTSMLSMSVYSSTTTNNNKPRPFINESTVSLRLTKLLRQMQQFQGLLKIGR